MRLIRRLFVVAVAVSSALAAVTFCCWGLTCFGGECYVPVMEGKDRRTWVGYEEGRFVTVVVGPGTVRVPAPPVSDEWMADRQRSVRHVARWGFGHFRGDSVVYGMYEKGRGVKMYQTIHFGVFVPGWMIAGLFLILPALWGWRRVCGVRFGGR